MPHHRSQTGERRNFSRTWPEKRELPVHLQKFAPETRRYTELPFFTVEELREYENFHDSHGSDNPSYHDLPPYAAAADLLDSMQQWGKRLPILIPTFWNVEHLTDHKGHLRAPRLYLGMEITQNKNLSVGWEAHEEDFHTDRLHHALSRAPNDWYSRPYNELVFIRRVLDLRTTERMSPATEFVLWAIAEHLKNIARELTVQFDLTIGDVFVPDYPVPDSNLSLPKVNSVERWEESLTVEERESWAQTEAQRVTNIPIAILLEYFRKAEGSFGETVLLAAKGGRLISPGEVAYAVRLAMRHIPHLYEYICKEALPIGAHAEDRLLREVLLEQYVANEQERWLSDFDTGVPGVTASDLLHAFHNAGGDPQRTQKELKRVGYRRRPETLLNSVLEIDEHAPFFYDSIVPFRPDTARSRDVGWTMRKYR